MLFEIVILLQIILVMNEVDIPETNNYALQPVHERDYNKLASIRFGNAANHLCTGVILGRRTIMTSAPCINAYIPMYSMLQDDFGAGKCIVVVNATKEEENEPGSEQRLCKKFTMNNQTWWSYGKQVTYGYPVNILVDLPLDKKNAERMETSPATLEGFDLCKIYGWVIPPEGGDQKVLMSTVAMLMDIDKCIEMHQERLRQHLPENQFCVVESRITDDGRIIVCDRKLLGVFTRRMPIIYGWETGNVNLYTFASTQSINQIRDLYRYSFWICLYLFVVAVHRFVL